MKKGLFLLFVLLVFGSSDCFSQSDRWVYVIETESFYWYYDSKTIKYENNIVTVYIKTIYKKSEYSEIEGKYIEYDIVKNLIYCREYKTKMLSGVYYYTDGTSKTIPLYHEIDIVPDTAGESLLLKVCR